MHFKQKARKIPEKGGVYNGDNTSGTHGHAVLAPFGSRAILMGEEVSRKSGLAVGKVIKNFLKRGKL